MNLIKTSIVSVLLLFGVVSLAQEPWNQVNNSGTDFILYGMSLPEGQNEIGYACGMQYTYDADGVIVKTTDGGDNWEQILPSSGTIDGLQSICFIDENTGFAGGWNNYFIKTTDGGATWEDVSCGSDVWYYTDIKFWDENNGVVSAYKYNVSPGIFVTNDGGDTWTPASGINNNLWAVEYADQNTLFALNFTGLPMKSIDGGNSWSAMANPPAALLLGLDFANAEFGVIGAEEKIFATSDGGDTWTEYFTGYENFYACKAFEDGTAYVGGTDNRIHKTTDFGESWTLNNIVSSASSLYQVEVMGNGTLFAGGSQGTILRNETNVISGPVLDINPNPVQFNDTSIGEVSSQNVNFANIGTETIEITDITFTNAAFSIDYTAFNIEPGESGDLPVNFEPTVAGLNEGIMQVWSNDPNSPFEVELTGNAISPEGWYYVSNSGTSFILYGMSIPPGQSDIAYACGMEYTYNADGVIVKSTDGGNNWEQILPVSGDINGLQAICFIDENTGFAAGWNNYFIKTTDGGITWTNVTVGSDVWYYTDIEFWDENNGVASAYQNGSDPGIYITSDGGETWSSATSGANYNLWAVDYADQNTLFALNLTGYAIKSIDGGNTWSTLASSPPALLLGLDFANADFGVVGAEEKMFATTDGGNIWTEFVTGYENFYACEAFANGIAYIGGTDEHIWITTDFGQTWTMDNAGMSSATLYQIEVTDNGTLFSCGSQGVILRNDGLSTEPSIEVNPDEIFFEDTFVGESSSETITVNNSGFATLEISDITTDNDVFTIDMTSFTLEPGEEQELEVSFTPELEGLAEGILQINCNDLANETLDVALAGSGMMMLPDLGVEPVEIFFDTTLLNETSMEFITISNTGNATLDVTDIVTTNNVFTVNMASFSIEPENSQQVEITFAPTSQMMFEGELQIESNDPDGTVLVNLEGYGDIDVFVYNNYNTEDVNIYPNPVQDLLYIKNIENSKVYIYDLLGNLKLELHKTANTEQVNVSNFIGGIYIVKIINDRGTFIRKIEVRN